MVAAHDFDIKVVPYDSTHTIAWNITNNLVAGTSYYPYWVSCTVRQKMSDVSTFSFSMGGVDSSTLPVHMNDIVGVYYIGDEGYGTATTNTLTDSSKAWTKPQNLVLYGKITCIHIHN